MGKVQFYFLSLCLSWFKLKVANKKELLENE